MPPQSICSDLHSLVRHLHRYSFPPPEVNLPLDGVYFIFEQDETAHGGERIVRVGSHTGSGNLAARLREHLTSNKDRSIFRKHLGRAILNRDHDPFLKCWNIDLTSRDHREHFAHLVDMNKQADVEASVTAHVQTRMSVAVIPMTDSKAALGFERLCIGTLSQCLECFPSAKWLGTFSPLDKIRESGLWQSQGLYGEGLSEDELRKLTQLAGIIQETGNATATFSEGSGKSRSVGAVKGDYLYLSDRFTSAIDYARHLHVEPRKGTGIPYMAHLLGVASLVMGEAGHSPILVTEDMVIAALLHDAVEDHGGLMRLRDIEHNFGRDVGRMVEGLSDSFAEDSTRKPEWDERKRAYLVRLRNEPDDVRLIAAADKLYNARAILDDYRDVGPQIWERFKRGRDQQLCYFQEILKVFRSRARNRIMDELERVVAELEAVGPGDSH